MTEKRFHIEFAPNGSNKFVFPWLGGRIMKIKCSNIIVLFLVLSITVSSMSGCNVLKKNKKQDQIEYVIGISQANMREPWRLVLTKEIEEEAKKHPGIRLISTDATSDTKKQKKDIERLLEYGIDLLIISPSDVKIMTPIISKVYKRIPVIVMDRAVEGFDYTLFIGPDNELIGKQAGEDIVNLIGNKRGSVLEIRGNKSSQAGKEKSAGFESILSQYSNIHTMQRRIESEFKDEAEDTVLAMGGQLEDVDVIFAHNDYMALGAYTAVQKLGYDIKIVGIDGFIGENDGLDLVKQGKIYETIACPTGGKEAIQYALDILGNVSGVPKQVILRSHGITKDNVEEYVASLNKPLKEVTNIIDVGYSQVGTESAWRLANTSSIKGAAKDMGINLIYEDANQSQEKQIEAIRKFIDMKVDVIVVSPVVDSGWDEVLEEVKDAGIPVLLSDRKIEVDDDKLFMTYIGADFVEEGRRAMRWIIENTGEEPDMTRIMELKGTLGASPTEERKKGFEEILKVHSEYEIVYSKSGDFTYQGGKQIIEDYLRDYDRNIDIIFAHNDDMALGAIEALKENGIKPGKEVKIVSVDGTKEAFKAMIDGELNCAVECSPLLGPQLMKAVQDLMSGKELPLRIITDEKVFTQVEAKEVIGSRRY